jgi:DNA-binding MarR family transcriptional regulator
VHQPLRLQILAALNATPETALDFTRLKAITKSTDGNLGRQINTLAEAGYIDVQKDFHRNRPRTRAQLTPAGAAAFAAYAACLRALLGGA